MANFTATNSPVLDCLPGATIKLESAIAAATAAYAGKYYLVLMLYVEKADGTWGHVWERIMWGAPALTTAPQTISAGYTLPTTLAPGKYEVRASVRDMNWHWLDKDIAQTPAVFNVGTVAPVVPAAPAAPKPLRAVGDGFLPDDGKTYVSVFSDEFDGTTLDGAKWFTRYKDNNGTLDHYNDELQRYNDGHVVSGGTLKLTAKPNGQTFTAPTGKVYQMYGSQMIRSREARKYGYTEMRGKLPPGTGVFAAGWDLEAALSTVCELTGMEYVRTDVNERKNMLHLGNINLKTDHSIIWHDPAYNTQNGFWTAPYTIADSFHVISWLWEPGVYTTFLDGKPIVQRKCDWKNAAGGDGGLASFIANLAMGGSWATTGATGPWETDVATDPQIFEIDYIRISQVAGQIMTGLAPVPVVAAPPPPPLPPPAAVGTITSFSSTPKTYLKVGGDRYYIQTSGKSYSLTNPDPQTLRFEIRPGDRAWFDGPSVDRSEIMWVGPVGTTDTECVPAGTPTVIDYQFMVEPNGPNNTFINTAWFFVTAENHDGGTVSGTSPAFAMQLGGGRMQLVARYVLPGGNPAQGSPDLKILTLWTSPTSIIPGQFYSINIQANVSNSGGGYLKLAVNGQPVVNYSGPLGYGSQTYWEEGLYRNSGPTETVAAQFRSLKMTRG